MFERHQDLLIDRWTPGESKWDQRDAVGPFQRGIGGSPGGMGRSVELVERPDQGRCLNPDRVCLYLQRRSPHVQAQHSTFVDGTCCFGRERLRGTSGRCQFSNFRLHQIFRDPDHHRARDPRGHLFGLNMAHSF